MTQHSNAVKWYISGVQAGKAAKDLVVIGASAGGVDALKRLVAQLPEDVPAAILIVLHIWPEGPSVLPQILDRAGDLTAVHPLDGEELAYGRIYVAPPDCHMIVEPGVVRLIRGPRENRHRPAIDPLFRSAAAVYGARVIACVLTGMLDDGTAGAMAVHRQGGTIIVQDPADAVQDGMPSSVIHNVAVDYVLPLAEIPGKIVELASAGGRAATTEPFADTTKAATEVRFTAMDFNPTVDDGRPGTPSTFACPECSGTLWELDEGGLLRFRCRVGHAFSADALSAEQSDRLEEALWIAFRALGEAAALHRRMAQRANTRGHKEIALEHAVAAQSQEDSARVLRDMILKPRPEIEHEKTGA